MILTYSIGKILTYEEFSKLHWQSDWMYSELFDNTVKEEDDFVIGFYSNPNELEDYYIRIDNLEILHVFKKDKMEGDYEV